MDWKRRPPEWLVAFVPVLGDRHAREAWREWFADTRVPDFITGITAGKVLETLIVMFAPVLVGEPIAWEARGELWLYCLCTLLSFVVSVFRYHLSRGMDAATDAAADAVDSASEKITDAADAVDDAVGGDGEDDDSD